MTDNSSWQWKTLGEISLLKSQYGSGAKRVDFDGEVRYVRITDIEDNGALKQGDMVSPSVIEDNCFLKEGDLLFARSGSVGRTYLHQPKDTLKYQFAGYLIRFKINPDVADSKYVFYLTHSRYYYDWIESYKKSVTLANINAQEYASLKLPVPPLSEQKKIVELLERSDNLRQKRQQTNDETTRIVQSIFYDMFGDPVIEDKYPELQLGKITKFIDYRGKTPKKTDFGVPLITAKNVKLGYISPEPQEFIADKDYEPWMRRGFPEEGDILFTTEAPLANVARLGQFDRIALAQRIITLHPSDKVDSHYLTHLLLLPSMRRRINKYVTGSTATGIRSRELKILKIPLPDIKMQKIFAERVKKMEPIHIKQKKCLSDINQLFDALMQKAFNGELVA